MSEEQNGMMKFGQSLVNVRRLLAVTYHEQDGVMLPYGELTFDTGQTVAMPAEDAKELLNYFPGSAGTDSPTGTTASTSSSET